MILECPTCSARFNVDSELIGTDGRTVRCGSCGHSWHQTPRDIELDLDLVVEEEGAPGRETGAAADEAPEDDIEARLSETRRRAKARGEAAAAREKTARFPLPVGWLVLILVVAVLVIGGIFGRSKIIALAPGTSTVFEFVGLQEAVGAGLEMKDVTSAREAVDGVNTLLIRGVIVNATDRDIAVPQLQASLVDADGVELASWTFDADSSELPPGGFTTFETSAQNPPAQGNVNLVFIE